jgi:hypothetical protein
MSKLARLIEALQLPIIAAISLLVLIADLFGLFHLIPTSSVPMLTLLLVSLALNALAVIQKRTAEINERTKLLLSRISIEQLEKEAIEEIDPGLRKVLQDEYFLDAIRFLITAINEGKVPVNDLASLRYYYIRTLNCFQGSTFFLNVWSELD